MLFCYTWESPLRKTTKASTSPLLNPRPEEGKIGKWRLGWIGKGGKGKEAPKAAIQGAAAAIEGAAAATRNYKQRRKLLPKRRQRLPTNQLCMAQHKAHHAEKNLAELRTPTPLPQTQPNNLNSSADACLLQSSEHSPPSTDADLRQKTAKDMAEY